MHKAFNNERGVVLLTCLVFLMVLLAMLRFALTSARVEEQKAGLDLEILSARESAQMALSEAERLIMSEGRRYCEIKYPAKGSACRSEAAKYAAELFGNVDILKAESRLVGQGIYTADTIKAANCEPFWSCVSWSNRAPSLQQALQSRTPFAPINCLSCNINGAAVTPQYVIEHFFIEDINGGSVPNKSKSVVLRVTALGFGKGSDASEQLSSTLVQATYLFPNNS